MRGSGIGSSKLSPQSAAQSFQFVDLMGHRFPSLSQIQKLIAQRLMLNKCGFSPALLRMGATSAIFVRLATRSGRSFTAGFGIGWKISVTHPSKEAQRMMLKLANDYEVISS